MIVYLDNAASTQVHKSVLNGMRPYFSKNFGNPSSLHSFGRKAKNAIENVREKLAKKINCSGNELYFTSGGTESNNLALKGLFFANKDKTHIIVSKIEHDSILNPACWLEKQGAKISYLDVDREGFVDLEKLENLITNDTLLVSIIHGNNEIGTIQNLEKIGKICSDKNVLFHSDACQSFTKSYIDIKRQNIDLLTISSHKIYGPKGIGALYVKEGIKIDPLMHGGNQESALRSGTENVPGIVGFGVASDLITKAKIKRMEHLRDYFIKRILGEIDGTILNGPTKNRLCNNVNITFKGIEGESIVLHLDSYGIKVSTGSACASHSLEPSHVLLAIGVKKELAHGSIRFSLVIQTKKEELSYTMDALKEITAKLRKISPIRW